MKINIIYQIHGRKEKYSLSMCIAPGLSISGKNNISRRARKYLLDTKGPDANIVDIIVM